MYFQRYLTEADTPTLVSQKLIYNIPSQDLSIQTYKSF